MTIWAAGGVVWRSGPDGAVEILVIHRPRYDDWSLPKGKRNRRESDEDCARREVEEETGVRCRLGEELPTVRYDVEGEPKVVRFWAMTVDSGTATPDGNEVDVLEWLPAVDVVARLDREGERSVVSAFLASDRR